MRKIHAWVSAMLLISPWAGAETSAQAKAITQKNPKSIIRNTQTGVPRIEVLFVLDTTGSMGGLIEGAKLKIWSIANQMLRAKPTPKLRIGLLGYRDRGDAYITQFFDLSEDIDAIYAKLQQFNADGGGDTPESVNQALQEAVTRPSWSQDQKVLKIVFLVGDAPPHMNYQNDIKYPVSCRMAVQRDLIINAIQCGQMAETTPFWQEIASLSGGSYMSIGQTGDMQAISTPMDSELAKLNVEVGRTIVAYGAEPERREVLRKQAVAEAAAPSTPSVVADRLAFNQASGSVVQGGGDLLDGLISGKVKLDRLDSKKLPQEMQTLSPDARKAYLKTKRVERDKVQARISDLSKKRQAFIDAENKKRASAGKGEAFDLKVAEAIREQAKRKGIKYESK